MPESNASECPEQDRLCVNLRHALGSLVEMQSSQMAAITSGNQKGSKFDEEIRIALQAWEHARYVYIRHVLDHGCRSSQDLI